MEVLKLSGVVHVFRLLWIKKKKNLHFYSSNIACQQYWSSEQISLEIKVWVSSFPSIRSSSPELFPKKGVLKIILQNSVEIIRDAVFSLIKFHSKGLQLYWKEIPAYVLSQEFCRFFKSNYFVERQQTATSKISSKN